MITAAEVFSCRGRTGQEIGIFVHLDVVHEGNGWTTEPYKPVIKDGWLYGRGSADNKGPAAAALYSMKYLKEQEVPLEHTIRLYLGCSEERGMKEMQYYTSHYPAPEFSFTPDASFPVCYGEKGILEGEFSCAIPEGHVTGFFGRSGVQCGSGRGTGMAEPDKLRCGPGLCGQPCNPPGFFRRGRQPYGCKGCWENSACRLSRGF